AAGPPPRLAGRRRGRRGPARSVGARSAGPGPPGARRRADLRPRPVQLLRRAGSRMSTPWPDIARTYDVAAEHYAATFAGQLDGKRFERDLFDRYAAALPGPGEATRVGWGTAGRLAWFVGVRCVAAARAGSG